MNSKIRDVVAVICALVLLSSLPTFMARKKPIEVSLPQMNPQEVVAKEELQQKQAQAVALQNKLRRIYACTIDEDCIIVDKDPCGCTIGPKGVVAINVNYILDFNAINNQKSVTTTCPETTSRVKECSPTARPVCKAHRCKISY